MHPLHAFPEREEIDRAQHEIQQGGADAEAYEYFQQQERLTLCRERYCTLTAIGSVRYNDLCAS